MGQIEIKQSAGKIAINRKEILATFDSVDDRDYIKSLGFKLAAEKESGMSIYVPGHLLDNLYALNSVGFNIKRSQEGVKRSVKFDDSSHDIYLDICIGGNWRRILPHDAKAALKAAPGALSASNSHGIAADDLISLVKGDAVPGLTAVLVPSDGNDNSDQ